MMYGRAILPSFKKGGTLPLRSRHIKIVSNNTVQILLCDKVKYKDLGLQKHRVEVALETKGQAKIILDKLYSGEYKLSDSQLQQHGNNWYLIVAHNDDA